ncbi:MAG: phnD [Anaerospora sp.]|nr:phnD [Anaerospora sp.]
MNRKACLCVCLLLIVLVTVCGFTGRSFFFSKSKFINFEKLEAPPAIAAVNADSQALRVAISSVLLPQETVVHYRSIANFLGLQVDRPVMLIQRKSYAEIALHAGCSAANGSALSSGIYYSG